MFKAMPRAATRESRPTIKPRPPKNSAAIARIANNAGICMVFVKKPMVPLKPSPPNQPNIFCAPCAKNTTPSANRRIAVAASFSVEMSFRNIVPPVLSLLLYAPFHEDCCRSPRSAVGTREHREAEPQAAAPGIHASRRPDRSAWLRTRSTGRTPFSVLRAEIQLVLSSEPPPNLWLPWVIERQNRPQFPLRRYSSRAVKHLAHLARERERGEGLLEECDAGLDDPVAHHGVVRVAAHVEDSDAGVVLHDPLDQLAAAHLGHHDIRDDELNFAGVHAGRLERLGSVPGLDHPVAGRLERDLYDAPYGVLVLDDEDGLGSARHRAERRAGAAASPRPGLRREDHRERRALAGFARDRDVAAALLHDAEDRREPEAGSLAHSLRREEGFEEMGLDLRGDADARVRDRDCDLRTQLPPRSFLEVDGLFRVDISRADREPASARHRVARVHGEVHDDLLELARVNLHPAGVGRKVGQELHVLADEPAEHLLDPGDDLVHVHELRLEDLLAAKGEELAGEVGRALPGRADVGQCRAPGIVGRHVGQEEVGVPGDDREEVVEIVGDASRELADRLHLLRLAELLFEAHAGRYVHPRAHDLAGAVLGVEENALLVMQPDPDPVLPAEAEFDHCMTLVEDGLVRRDDALQVVGMDALFPPALRIARPDLRVRVSGQGMDVLGKPRGAEPAGSEAERVDDRRTACKEARRSLLCSLALEIQADLPPESLDQGRVDFRDLGREELEDAGHLAAEEEGEGESGGNAGPRGGLGAREARPESVLMDDAPGLPDLAGNADAAGRDEDAALVFQFGGARGVRAPCVHAAEAGGVSVLLPPGTEGEALALAERPQDPRHRLGEGGGLRENAPDRGLHRDALREPLALGDVFDDADRAHGRARVVPEDDHVHVHPRDRVVLADVPFLDLVLGRFAPDHALE